MSLVADITKTKEKSFLHEGKFYRWFSSAEFSEHVKTTVEHSRQLLIKTVKKNLVEKRKIAGVQHMLFDLKEYEGYSADGDYFVKND